MSKTKELIMCYNDFPDMEEIESFNEVYCNECGGLLGYVEGRNVFATCYYKEDNTRVMSDEDYSICKECIVCINRDERIDELLEHKKSHSS